MTTYFRSDTGDSWESDDEWGAGFDPGPAVTGLRLKTLQAQIEKELGREIAWPSNGFLLACDIAGVSYDEMPAAAQAAFDRYSKCWSKENYESCIAALEAMKGECGYDVAVFVQHCAAQGLTPPEWTEAVLEARQLELQRRAEAERLRLVRLEAARALGDLKVPTEPRRGFGPGDAPSRAQRRGWAEDQLAEGWPMLADLDDRFAGLDEVGVKALYWQLRAVAEQGEDDLIRSWGMDPETGDWASPADKVAWLERKAAEELAAEKARRLARGTHLCIPRVRMANTGNGSALTEQFVFATPIPGHGGKKITTRVRLQPGEMLEQGVSYILWISYGEAELIGPTD